MQKKIKAAVLGATGPVGQVFMWMLDGHPWMDVVCPVASSAKSGVEYGKCTHWVLPFEMTDTMARKKVCDLSVETLKKNEVQLVFSALPSDVAVDIEPELRKEGFWLFSNAAGMRSDENVPIMIPEANHDCVSMIKKQGYPKSGFAITNANCSTTGLAMALAPLRKFDIKVVHVSTYQSISGAGYPGLSFFDIGGNCIPYIGGEEEKMIRELQKILSIKCEVYPFCVRVPVMFGHLETVWVEFGRKVECEDILRAWGDFRLPYETPSTPEHPVMYCQDDIMPQQKSAFWGKPQGMTVYTGRLKKEGNKIGFVCMVNNLVKGAAGGSVQNAEVFLKTEGLVK